MWQEVCWLFYDGIFTLTSTSISKPGNDDNGVG